jgi:hypothetical protein
MTNMVVHATRRRRFPRLGAWFAVVYLALVLAVFAVTAIETQPSNVGLDWIPFWWLALPWSKMSPRLLFPGFLINAALLWILGTAIEALVRGLRSLVTSN